MRKATLKKAAPARARGEGGREAASPLPSVSYQLKDPSGYCLIQLGFSHCVILGMQLCFPVPQTVK